MADLTSPQQHLQIREAIQNVVDTFFDTPVSYFVAQETVNEYMEDVASDRIYTEHTFNALAEYTIEDEGKLLTLPAGKLERLEIKLTVGLDDLVALELIDENTYLPLFNIEEDYMIVNGQKYQVAMAVPNGAFERKNVLVVIYGMSDEKQEQ